MSILGWVLLFLIAVSVGVLLHIGSRSALRCPKCQGVMVEQSNGSLHGIVIHIVPQLQERKCQVCGYKERWLP
jgi:hypothetical protein